jgi:RNA polymerase sigma factor (sigma-70 family)
VRLPPFQVFLDQHRDEVFRFLMVAVGPVDADDCFQETFLSALKAYPGLRSARNLQAWIFTIARRKAIDHHRRVQREVLVAEAQDGIASPGVGEGREIWHVVRSLPPKQSIALAHRYGQDLPYRDVARLMGVSEEAARRNVHEGIKKLREVYTP